MFILQIVLFAMLLGTGAKESVRDIWILATNAIDDLGQRAYSFLVENYLKSVKSCEAFDCPLDPKLGLTSWENMNRNIGLYFVNEMLDGQSYPLFPTDVMEAMYDGTMVPAERYFGIPAQPSPSEMWEPCAPQASSSAGGMNAFTFTPHSVERKQDNVKQVLDDVIDNYNVKVDVDIVKCNIDSDGSNANHMDVSHGTVFHMYPNRPGRGRGRRGVLGMASRGSVIIRQPRNFVR